MKFVLCTHNSRDLYQSGGWARRLRSKLFAFSFQNSIKVAAQAAKNLEPFRSRYVPYIEADNCAIQDTGPPARAPLSTFCFHWFFYQHIVLRMLWRAWAQTHIVQVHSGTSLARDHT